MKDALNYIVSSIVDNKEKVQISEESEGDFLTFTISVDPQDMGKIIGKNGKIIRAIRNAMKIPAIKQNKRINVVLGESSN